MIYEVPFGLGMVDYEEGIMVGRKPLSWPRMMCSEAMGWELLVFSWNHCVCVCGGVY